MSRKENGWKSSPNRTRLAESSNFQAQIFNRGHAGLAPLVFRTSICFPEINWSSTVHCTYIHGEEIRFPFKAPVMLYPI